jgi:alpha-mannosidase
VNKKNIYIVSHTHWDREWYFTIEDSNILLIENLQKVIDTLEEKPSFSSYAFDAQASIIDEFLKINPEVEENLRQLIKNKKIFVGPWYTQTDTLLVNKESIIRNLLYGTSICESFGHSMNIGYLPDTFGQNQYLPSIFREFDIDYSIVKRGIYHDEINNDVNFKWKSPDGKEIKSNYMILGYSPGEFIEDSDEYIEKTFLPLIKKLEKTNKNSENLLFLVGGDQNLIKENLPEIVKTINNKVENYNIILSDFENFMDDTWKNNSFKTTLNNELRATEAQRVHRTIGSMRYDIKKLNSEVENNILNILEPLAVIGMQFGIKYPQQWIDYMWKQLFDAHAHDSIGGCNSDDTNAEVINRLKKVDRISKGLINLLKKRITYSISKSMKKDNILVLFNTNFKIESSLKESVIFTKNNNFKLIDLNGNQMEIDIVSQDYISGGKKIIVTENGDVEIELPGYYRSEVLIKTGIPSMGWTTLMIDENIEVKETKKYYEDEIKIENETIKIEVIKNKLDITKFNSTIKDFISFENCADYGDSYDFSPLKNDLPLLIKDLEILDIKKNKFSESLKISHTIYLPKDLEERKKEKFTTEITIFTTLELRKGENLVRIQHNIENNVKDHRLRILFKTDFNNISNSFSDSGFSTISHPIIEKRMTNWKKNGYVEAPVPIYNMENTAFLIDDSKIFGVITKGLKEYEILKNNTFALTLYRGIGLLGRDNLIWRPNRASGINNTVVKTPNGQLLGNLEFNYAIYFENTANINNIYKNIERFISKTYSYQKQDLNSFEERLERFSISHIDKILPKTYSLFEIDNQEIYMSICKKSHIGNKIIIRVFNPSEGIKKFRILGKNILNIEEVQLNEKHGKLIIDEITIEPKNYKTFLLFLKN